VYCEPALSIEQQIEHFRDKNLIILNEDRLEKALSRISYYRLKEYAVPFLTDNREKFVPDTNEQHILDLYIFDHFLRMSVFEAAKVIEVALRSKIANHFSVKYGPSGYIESANFKPDLIKHTQLKDQILDEIDCKSKDRNLKSIIEKNGDNILPLWIVFEYVPFGTVSQFYNLMKTDDKKIIAREFSVNNEQVFKSWIHTVNYIRNICAHHARLFNTVISISPKSMKPDTINFFSCANTHDKIFYSLTILLYLLQSIDSPVADRYKENIRNLIARSELSQKLNGFEIPMGMSEGWDTCFPWK
jgi:abortive infection bacteriophage resistance protein